jgi:hypothetical protein
MTLPNHETTTFTNHSTFYAIAHRNYIEVQRLKAEHDKYQSDLKDKEITNADVDFLAEKNAAIQRHAMVVVIFSALTLEAFINHYAIENFSKSYLNNYLDKLDPVSKWIVIPKLVLGQTLDTDGQPFELLQRLFSLRNTLVHYKTRIKRIDEIQDNDWIREDEAEEAIQAVWKVVGELSNLDDSQAIDWLKEAETNPYA